MATSSGSPATSDEIYPNSVRIPNYLPRRPNCCEHGRALVRVSRTPQNPGRRFYCCRQNLCAHWDWIDEELTDHYRGIMNEYRSERDVAQEQLRNAELREQLISEKLRNADLKEQFNSEQLEALRKECSESQTRICELKRSIEDLDCCIADLQGKMDSLEITVASQKKKIRVLKKAIFILLIFICCVIFMK